MRGVTYDTGVLIAAERADVDVRATHDRLLAHGITPTVPANVLAQAWRGGPQPRLSRLLRGCRIAPVDERQARQAGTALARSATSDVVDATVVIAAATRGDVVLTGDPDDLRRIADAVAPDLPIHAI
ncbi:MAG: PIN domain-containing protein [Solirubrobacteraceae bacterium]